MPDGDADSSDPMELCPPTPEMAEKTPQPPQEPKKPFAVPANVAFSLCPPSQRTRDAVVRRLIGFLSAPSFLSNRYGTIPPDEAAFAARLIEEEALAVAAAGGSSGGADDHDGIEILKFYSKELSKRMLAFVKSRSSAAAFAAEEARLRSSQRHRS